jgi:hypothetical protein
MQTNTDTTTARAEFTATTFAFLIVVASTLWGLFFFHR